MQSFRPLRSPFFGVALVLLTACSDRESPEQQVRSVIDAMELAAEARDVGDLMEHISDNYRDAQGQSREEAARYARGYFIANQSVHLLTRIESLEFPAPDEARVKVQVGMAGRGAETGQAGLSAGTGSPPSRGRQFWRSVDLHDFDLVLVREGGGWKVSYADWGAH